MRSKKERTEEEKQKFREEEAERVKEVLALLAADEDTPEFDRDIHDDYTVRRFLRARHQNVQKAKDMLSASLKWRKQVGADNILEEAPKSDYFLLLHRYWPSRFHKTDREGSLVLFERIGVADAKALVSAVPKEECIRYHVWQQEYARLLKKEMSSKEGTNKFPQVIVADLAGLGWSHMHGPAIDVFKQIVAIDEANYPECLKAFYVINAPKLFTMAFRMIRPLLDPKTLSKVHVLGADYKEALVEAIHEDNLPKAYGGNCDCGGTSCQGYFHDETEVVVPFWDSERQEVLYRSFLPKENEGNEGEEMEKSKNKEKDEKATEASERHCIPGGGAFDGVEREENGTNRLPIQVMVGRKGALYSWSSPHPL
ncbi:CRAL-TRIO domain-containing protein, variant 2 [Balamuthia mandrillaris]